MYDKAGITDPWNADRQVTEIYVPFAWFEAMWLENLGFCRGRRRLEEVIDRGEQKLGAHLPINPSGGVLCTQSDRRLGHDPSR